MKASRILSMALENLRQRKLRTTLTTLGVVIGIAAIVSLAALGEGFRLEVKQRMEAGFELHVLIVFPGSITAGLGSPFRPSDVGKIEGVQNVSVVAPVTTLPTAKVFRNNTGTEERMGAFSVGAVNFTKMQEVLPQRFRLADGNFPAQNDNDTIVFGYKTATYDGIALVDIGQNVTLSINITEKISGHDVVFNLRKTLRVAAILQEGGTPGITNFDYWAFISTDLAAEILQGDYYQIILVQISDLKQSEQVASAIETKFEKYSISILVPSMFVQQVDSILNLLQIFLMAVASISLLVAGIGIMNIMTVSVMERTKEVGILKAIGAKSRTVLSMFLAEASLVGAAGGIIGILTGYGLSYGMANVLSSLMQPEQSSDLLFSTPGRQPLTISPVFTAEWTVAAFVFAIVICIVFGLYPARKAAKLDPVKALHYE